MSGSNSTTSASTRGQQATRPACATWRGLLVLPVALWLILSAGLVILWCLDHRDDQHKLVMRSDEATRHWARSLEQQVAQRIIPLQALRGEQLGGHPLSVDEFTVVARTLYDKDTCRRLAWIDAGDHCIATYPANGARQFADELRTASWQQVLRAARANHQKQMGETLDADGLLMPCAVPLFDRDNYQGAFVATLDLAALFQELLDPVHADFRTALLDNQQRVVARGRGEAGAVGSRWTTHRVNIVGRDWTLRLGPTPELASRLTGAPLWTLLVGLLAALLISFGVFQALYLRDREAARSRAYLQALEKLNHFSYSVSSKLGSTRMVLDGLVQAATELLGMTRAGILRVDEASGRLEVVAYHGDVRPNVASIYRLADLPLLSKVIAERRYFFSGDIYAPTAAIASSNMDVLRAYGVRSLVVIPLVLNNRLHGLMPLSSSEPRVFKEADRHLAELLGTHASVILANNDLYEQTRRDAEAKARLLRELNHRVKNNLASIVGLLSMGQPRLLPQARQWLDRAIARITTMSQAHGLFSGSIQQVELSHLIGQIVESLSVAKPPGVSIVTNVQGPGISLATDRAVSLAMVLHELCFNALVHGTGDQGQVTVRVRRIGLPLNSANDTWAGGSCVIEVIDEARQGKATAHKSSGIGLTLVEGLVAKELHGRFSLSTAPGGATVAKVEFPLSAAEAAGKASGHGNDAAGPASLQTPPRLSSSPASTGMAAQVLNGAGEP